MLGIVDKALGIVDKVLERSNLKLSREPMERVRSLRLDILEERAKGDVADQQKIAAMYDQLSVELDTLSTEISAGTVGDAK